MGTMTFGGKEQFASIGSTGLDEARRRSTCAWRPGST
jgi:hypothetical protein